MIQKKKLLVMTAALVLSASCGFAQESSTTVAVKAGTLGGGAEASFSMGDHLQLRGGVNYLRFSFDSTISNIDYEMEPEFKNASLLLDYHPFAGVFRLSAGVFFNDSEIGLDGKPRRDTYLAGYEVPAEYAHLEHLANTVRVNGVVEFNSVAPYLGIGWNSNGGGQAGWGVGCEMGVLFMGSPKVSALTASAAEPLGSYSGHPEVVQALEEERQAIENDLEDYEYYPVASITLQYRF